jgi:DNA repair exonuclease SbcCD ATPase subunit
MKLLSLQLRPFGGATDRTFCFTEKIQSLEGPNEFGKSSFFTALSHVLFTNNLTKKRCSDVLGKWFPKGGGDYVEITLCIESGGTVYQIEKRWGENPSSKVINKTSNVTISNSEEVASKINEVLGHNQATWENVFFIPQAEIRNTIKNLKGNVDVIEDASQLTLGIEALLGDFNPQVLKTKISNEAETLYGNWDQTENCPKKDGKGNYRGIDNKWSNGNGAVIKAWYKWKEDEKSVNERYNYDQEVDRINSQIRENELSVKNLGPIVERDQKLYDSILQFRAVDAELKTIDNDLKSLRKVAADWRNAEVKHPIKVEEIKNKSDTLNDLKIEQSNANLRNQSASIQSSLKIIDHLVKEKENLLALDAETKKVDCTKLENLEQIEWLIKDLDVEIKAQSLVATLKSDNTTTVMVTTGSEITEEISLNAGIEQEINATGQIQFFGNGLMIVVRSGKANLDLLITELKEKKLQQSEILAELDFPSSQNAKDSAKLNKEITDKIKINYEKLNQALTNKTIQEWEIIRSEHDNIPQTRDKSVIDNEIQKIGEEKANLIVENNVLKEFIDECKKSWTYIENLENKIVEKTIEWNNKKTEKASLPSLPDGFKFDEKFEEDHKSNRKKHTSAKELIPTLLDEIRGLPLPSTEDCEELKERLQQSIDTFTRELEHAQSLKRITSAIDRITGANDPYAGLSDLIMKNFKALTNDKYININHEKGLPAEVGTNVLTLETASLSQGATASLAVAIRLSLAELYLKKAPAFLVMDDPFVDLDPDRRAASVKLLQKFGEKTQIILLTCHPGHAKEIGEKQVSVQDKPC